jgi:hypothetical protein
MDLCERCTEPHTCQSFGRCRRSGEQPGTDAHDEWEAVRRGDVDSCDPPTTRGSVSPALDEEQRSAGYEQIGDINWPPEAEDRG